MATIDVGMIYQALLGGESQCGDIAVIKEYDGHCFLALVDVLGHGSEARKIALHAKGYLEKNYHRDIVDIMNGLHEYLKGTRGAVAAVCNLDISTGKLSYVGTGNITVRILGLKSVRLIAKDGIIGYRMTKPHQQTIEIHNGETLLMHSDGIKEHFDVLECRGLFEKDAGAIVQGVLRQFGKKNDDSCCIALKYLR